MNWPKWGNLILQTQPISLYKEIREDLVQIYIEAYRAYPQVRYAFDQETPQDLRDRADKHAFAARHYDPHASAHDAQQFFAGIYRSIIFGLVVLFVVSVITSSSLWIAESRGLLKIVGGIPLSIIIGGPLIPSFLVAVVILYIQILTFSTWVIQTLNRELAFGVNKTRTRIKPRLVGYVVWNSSLSGKAIHLLAVFSILKFVSNLPGVNAYESIRDVVKENIHLFIGVTSYRDGFRLALKRIREIDGTD